MVGTSREAQCISQLHEKERGPLALMLIYGQEKKERKMRERERRQERRERGRDMKERKVKRILSVIKRSTLGQTLL